MIVTGRDGVVHELELFIYSFRASVPSREQKKIQVTSKILREGTGQPFLLHITHPESASINALPERRKN